MYMTNVSTEVALNDETRTEITILATAVLTNRVGIVDMNTQLRRIAEHAGVVIGVIFEEVYQQAQVQLDGKEAPSSLKGNVAYQSLVQYHNNRN